LFSLQEASPEAKDAKSRRRREAAEQGATDGQAVSFSLHGSITTDQ